MKKKSLKRSSNEYVEIENFKDYELTNNIAYEMAIRNEEVKALIEEYDSLDEANKYETKEELLELIINDKFMPPRQREIDYILREDFFITSQRRFNDPDFSKTILYPSLNGFILPPADENLQYDDAWISSENITVASSFIPDFSRPFMLPPEKKDKRLPFFLNLGLPLNELISFITEIKKNYDVEHKKIITLIEALGNSLESSDTKVNLVKSRKFDSMEVLKYKIKIADMFFAYDAEKAGIRPSNYTSEIYEYHIEKDADTKMTFSENTRYKYLDVAKEYIDNLRYKELVTGIKH